MIYKAYGLPPEFLKEEGKSFLENKKTIPNTDTYDVKAFLESRGFLFPEGGEATYSAVTRGLLIKSDRKGIELADGLLERLCCDWPAVQLRARFTVYSFRGPVDSESGGQLGYQKLRELAGDTWTERARLSGLINQSMRSDLIHLTKNPALVASSKKIGEGSLPDGAFGQHLALEANLADNGITVSASIFLQFRDETEDGSIVDFSYSGFLSALLDTPVVVEIASAGNSKDKYAAILSFSVVSPLSEEPSDPRTINKPIVQSPSSGTATLDKESSTPSAPSPQPQ